MGNLQKIFDAIYEELSGKKKYFFPMKPKDIVELQDECIELLKLDGKDEYIENTFEFAEFLVRYILFKEEIK